jgi:hypothetical protein
VARERWRQPFVTGDVKPNEIIAIHLPWHDRARYAESDPRVIKSILAGEHDDLLTDDEYGPSLRYIKQKYGKVESLLRYDKALVDSLLRKR